VAPRTSYASYSDRELIVLYRKSGDPQILGELFQRYSSLVYGVCLKYLKDRDTAKDAVMSLFEKLGPSLTAHTVDNFRGWLYVSARNLCLMQLRAEKGRKPVEIDSYLMESAYAVHPADDDLEGDLRILEKCLETLGAEQQLCVRLFYLDKHCYQEICTRTGYEYKQVKSYIQNGKRNLKLCMEEHGRRD
jgi:RNA polymerase sigma-70 factor (ECF subfamily)